MAEEEELEYKITFLQTILGMGILVLPVVFGMAGLPFAILLLTWRSDLEFIKIEERG